MIGSVGESDNKRARRKRREAIKRRDDCMTFALRCKSSLLSAFWEKIADTQQDEADKWLKRI